MHYAKVVKRICEDLGVPSNHFVHIGQAVGPIELDLMELDDS
jgi:hypothetical protein